MIYRKCKKIMDSVSLLSLGCMRFPIVGENRTSINKKEVFEMLDYAQELGITYLDTAFLYHQGLSEVILGEYFSVNKKKMMVATKLPWWLCNNEEDCHQYFQMQLDRLCLKKIDVYLLQGINKKSWEKIKNSYIIDFLLELKKKGKVNYIGFSFHDTYEVFCDIVSYKIWDMCQLQMNVADMFSQATIQGVKKAYDEGIDVFIMEPLRGGKLINNIPMEIQEKFDELGENISVREWCFRWLYDSPYVSSILSGMSSLKQLKENIITFQNAEANCLSDKEKKLFIDICRLYNMTSEIPCTNCNYCMDCSNGLNIPQIFETYNSMIISDNSFLNRLKYKRLMSGEHNVKKCSSCGECNKKCPQKIDVIATINMIKHYLEFHYGHL